FFGFFSLFGRVCSVFPPFLPFCPQIPPAAERRLWLLFPAKPRPFQNAFSCPLRLFCPFLRKTKPPLPFRVRRSVVIFVRNRRGGRAYAYSVCPANTGAPGRRQGPPDGSAGPFWPLLPAPRHG